MKCWVTLVVSAGKASGPAHCGLHILLRQEEEEEDMQAAVSEKIDNMIADGELPPNWRGRKKPRR